MEHYLSIREEAYEEIQEAYDWYEEQRQGLGEEFLVAVEGCLKRIAKKPESFQRKYKDFRSALVTRFPFAIFFEISNNHIIVYSVFHTSREPLSWKK